MTLAERVYAAALRAAAPLLFRLARGHGKLARGIRARQDVLRRMEAWAAAERNAENALVWFHAPSVGEGRQALAVLRAFQRRRPDVQTVFTHFSPSAEAFARGVPADFADYLPLDVPDHVDRALAALRPAVIAFSKADVWPVLTARASDGGVALALLSATLPAASSRLRTPARALLAPAYRRLDRVAAVSAADADRFGALGVAPERRSVMGDARCDQVWERAAEVDPQTPWLRALRAGGAPVLVAGSTWPADERRLIPAVAALREQGMPLRLLLVPHEPTPRHLTSTEALLAVEDLRWSRFGATEWSAPLPEVVLVDRTGILGDVYAAAHVAYLGGGWGRAGLHSVLEPAAFGVPVLFGPRHQNAREAAELVSVGGAYAAPTQAALVERLELWMRDGDARRTAGAAARRYVADNLGAAERGAEVIEELLNG